MRKNKFSIIFIFLLALSILTSCQPSPEILADTYPGDGDDGEVFTGFSEDEDPFENAEIIYTETPDVLPEYLVVFDVNPRVGFYVDAEPTYPVCGVVYFNDDAKEMLDQVHLVDGSIYDSYAALYANYVRAGYAKEDENGRHLKISIAYYTLGDNLGEHEYELIPVENITDYADLAKMNGLFSIVNDRGDTVLNSGEEWDMEFMDGYGDEEYDEYVQFFNTGGDVEEEHEEPKVVVMVTKECPECKGSGICECEVCGGDGEAECSTCKGEGKLICDLCGGTTNQMCTNCSVPGHDDVKGNGVCNGCNGTGICKYCGGAGCPECDYQTGVTCKGCAGTGVCGHCHGDGVTEGTCPRCFGNNGYMICNGCDGEKVSLCQRCNGTGEATCLRCNGSGTIEEEEIE